MLETEFQFLMIILHSGVEQGQKFGFKGQVRYVWDSHPLH